MSTPYPLALPINPAPSIRPRRACLGALLRGGMIWRVRAWLRGVLRSTAVALAAASALQQGVAPDAMGATTRPVTVEHGHNRTGDCTQGLVALTFDDGPRVGTTKPLVRTLTRLKVPATFFEIGQHVAAQPQLSRFVVRHGFAVENHSWSHPDLTTLTRPAMHAQITKTAAAFRHAGVRSGDLMRPPYGAVGPRVDEVIAAHGLTPVLWDVDSGDWRGRTTAQITHSVLAQLVPERPNVVLQHDGVDNSPASVRAVPAIVAKARRRGYCFAGLGDDGRPTPPVPQLSVSVMDGVEGGRPVGIVLRLDRPTTVPTSVRLTSADGTAKAGADFTPLDTVVHFARGVTYAIVRVPVVADVVAEPAESFTVHLGDADGLHAAVPTATATITDAG